MCNKFKSNQSNVLTGTENNIILIHLKLTLIRIGSLSTTIMLYNLFK